MGTGSWKRCCAALGGTLKSIGRLHEVMVTNERNYGETLALSKCKEKPQGWAMLQDYMAYIMITRRLDQHQAVNLHQSFLPGPSGIPQAAFGSIP